MVFRINIWFKMENLDNYFRVRLFVVKSSQHVFNDYDTTGNVNAFLEKCKCTPSMAPAATDF